MSANDAKTDQQQLREYLLGQLPEDMADQLDARLFADDVLRQELEEAQDSLVEDFVYQRLTEGETEIFHRQIAQSLLLQQKVSSFRLLLSALERQEGAHSAPSALNFKQVLKWLSPALAFLLCLAIFLYIRNRHSSIETPQIAQVTAPSVPHPPDEHTAEPSVFFLSANVVRGSSTLPQIKIPSAGVALDIQVEVRSPSATEWDVSLLRDNVIVHSSQSLPLHRLGEEAYLSLRIASVRPGTYAVRYAPHDNSAAAQYRSFQATK